MAMQVAFVILPWSAFLRPVYLGSRVLPPGSNFHPCKAAFSVKVTGSRIKATQHLAKIMKIGGDQVSDPICHLPLAIHRQLARPEQFITLANPQIRPHDHLNVAAFIF